MYEKFSEFIDATYEVYKEEYCEECDLPLDTPDDEIFLIEAGRYYKKYTLAGIVHEKIEQDLQYDLPDVDVSVYCGEDGDFKVKFSEGIAEIQTPFVPQTFSHLFGRACVRYAIALLEHFEIEVSEENCKEIANYFEFTTFDKSELGYEFEYYLDEQE